MRSKKIYRLVFLLGCLNFFVAGSVINATINNPQNLENPFLDPVIKAHVTPYLLPSEHPMKATLDSIFSQSRVLENERTLIDAGFVVIAGPMPYSFVTVVRHPAIPGYVFKLYLDSESRCRKQIPNWSWLVRRCMGARGIKKIIKRKHIRRFLVPDKWLYIVPPYPYPSILNPQPIILMETDMEPESQAVTRDMWRKGITTKHLDELYSILKHGYGGHGVINLVSNVPFTKKRKFAFTDTEDPKATLNLKHICTYLSFEMANYWMDLINQ